MALDLHAPLCGPSTRATDSSRGGRWRTGGTLTGLLSSPPDTNGYYYTVIPLQLASTYRFRLKATIDSGIEFTTASQTYSTGMPTLTDIGLSFREEEEVVNYRFPRAYEKKTLPLAA
jgi:hypothetical protein